MYASEGEREMGEKESDGELCVVEGKWSGKERVLLIVGVFEGEEERKKRRKKKGRRESSQFYFVRNRGTAKGAMLAVFKVQIGCITSRKRRTPLSRCNHASLRSLSLSCSLI
jgi:hypothetical protein